MLLSEQLLGLVKDQTWTKASSGWIWADTPENSEHKTFFFFLKEPGTSASQEPHKHCCNIQRCPQLAGPLRVSKGNFSPCSCSSKAGLGGRKHCAQTPAVSTAHLRRRWAQRPCLLTSLTLSAITGAPEDRGRAWEMKAVPFPESHKFDFPRARLMLAPCIICTQSR